MNVGCHTKWILQLRNLCMKRQLHETAFRTDCLLCIGNPGTYARKKFELKCREFIHKPEHISRSWIHVGKTLLCEKPPASEKPPVEQRNELLKKKKSTQRNESTAKELKEDKSSTENILLAEIVQTGSELVEDIKPVENQIKQKRKKGEKGENEISRTDTNHLGDERSALLNKEADKKSREKTKISDVKPQFEKQVSDKNGNGKTNCTENRQERGNGSGGGDFNTDNLFIELHNEMEKFFTDMKMKVEDGYTCYKTSCTKISKTSRVKMSETADVTTGLENDALVVTKRIRKNVSPNESLYINKTTGCFVCRLCGCSGTWSELKDNLAIFKKMKGRKDHLECLKDVPGIQRIVKETPAQVEDRLKGSTAIEELTDEEYTDVQATFGCEGIRVETMKKYKIKYERTSQSLLVPILSPDRIVIGLKVLSPSITTLSDGETAKTVRTCIVPRSMAQDWFGWQTYNNEGHVVITSTIFDVMVLAQESGEFAVALAKPDQVLPQEVLPFMEKFSKITLWFGNDVKAWDTAKLFAKKLNNKRCYIIRPNADDASPLEALSWNLDIQKVLYKAQPISHQAVISFADIRDEVRSEYMHVDQSTGIKWKRFPTLTKLLKGHRRGELTVFTGPTGSGKTTFISEYSLDLCMQGVKTLWGSFEIKNSRLAQVLLSQFAQKNIHKHLGEFETIADEFSQLPLHFLTFHGQEDIRNVSEAMTHAAYIHDIEHVVVDNLQFLMGMDFNVTNRFWKQDSMIATFRKFATTMNCHVTLVIHPKKERDDEDLMISSIFGSAKAAQEADNVIILQDKRQTSPTARKCIQVLKNRFDGELGTMVLKFDRETKSFAVKDKPGVKEKETKKITKPVLNFPDEGNRFVD